MFMSANRRILFRFLLLINLPLFVHAAFGQEIIPLRVNHSDRAIIFIHGLDGDPNDTFRSAVNHKTWAEMMLADDRPLPGGPALSSFDMYTVDYRQIFSSNSSLEAAALDVSDLLESSSAFRDHSFVWIIAHSMGGLIAKRLVVDLERKPLLERRLAGMLFFGVPSSGANLANVANQLRAGVLLQWFGRNGRLIQDLTPQRINTYLEGLSNQFDDAVQDVRNEGKRLPTIYCAYEEKPMLSYGPLLLQRFTRVVPRLYSEAHCSGHLEGFPYNHIDLVKPDDRNSSVYRWTRSKIAESFRLAMQEDLIRIGGSNSTHAASLSKVVHYLQTEHAKIEPASGLPFVREDIKFASTAAASQATHIQLNNEVDGPTVAYALQKLPQIYPCISVKISPSRSLITIDVIKPANSRCGDQ